MTPTDAPAPAARTAGTTAWTKVLADQRKAMLVALGLVVAGFWVCGPFGEWRVAGSIAIGVVLGLANHLATERWLLKTISSGGQPTRMQMGSSTLVRLALLTMVAVGIAVLLWPDGIAVLLGLAIFRLIALVMTTLPLLRELKQP